jgi:hypothetical protein
MGPWTRTVAGGVFSCDAPVMLCARVGVVVVVAACWTSSPPRVEKPVEPSSVAAAEEVHATLRIDATPGPKHFQGVWLELAADKRWVIDYRPRELWRGFDGQSVIVTGHCYVPFGEALLATHFKVERMRFATSLRWGSVPILEVGPERLVRGMLVEHEYAAGSKLAGSRETRFQPDTPIDGVAAFQIAGGIGPDAPTFDTRITVKARALVGNRAYTSTSSDAQIWIVSTHAASYVEDPEHAPKIVPCPK